MTSPLRPYMSDSGERTVTARKTPTKNDDPMSPILNLSSQIRVKFRDPIVYGILLIPVDGIV